MTKPTPRIAVLIAAYNAEKIISRAITSLSKNTEPHDIIVVDDGSHTPLSSVMAAQPNLVVLRLNMNQGLCAALNHGLEYVVSKEYEFVARLDADDLAMPERLVIQRNFLDKQKDISLIGSWVRIVSEKGTPIRFLNLPEKHDEIERGMFYNNCMYHPTLMFRASLARQGIRYDEKLNGAEDYDFIRKIMTTNKVENIPQYLVDYTLSHSGISISQAKKQARLRLRVQLKYANWTKVSFYIGFLKSLAQYVLRYMILNILPSKPKTTNIPSNQIVEKETPVYEWKPFMGQMRKK